MQNNEIDHEVTQEDLDANPELVTEGVKVGDIIKLPMSDTLPTDEQKAEIEKEHPGSFPEFAAAPVIVPVDPALASVSVNAPLPPTEPRKRYRGKFIVREGPRVVGNQTFQEIVLEDGTQMDLTDAEYNSEVHISYPPNA